MVAFALRHGVHNIYPYLCTLTVMRVCVSVSCRCMKTGGHTGDHMDVCVLLAGPGSGCVCRAAWRALCAHI